MDKLQALHSFWSGFTIPAYDENSVPDSAVMPYITYEAANDYFGYPIGLTASLWYRSTSWADIEAKELEIADAITRGGKIVGYTGGAFWIRKANPRAQRMTGENDDSVRRIVLNVEVEFLD